MEDLVARVRETLHGKKVVVTGHRGFKGTWLAALLHELGAEVHGVGLGPPTSPSLFEVLSPDLFASDAEVDILDLPTLTTTLQGIGPDLVIHLAAQSLVKESYDDPVTTFATNSLGTVNLLAALRSSCSPAAVVVATTDKVYENLGLERGYHEHDALGGSDLYAASKAAAELAVRAWTRSFGASGEIGRIATARGGNVIGGGDYAPDRIVPDLVRSTLSSEPITLRRPSALRPWQHVLDCLFGYLLLGTGLLRGDVDPAATDAFNFGPQITERRTVGELVDAWAERWPIATVKVAEHTTFAEHGLLWITSDLAQSHLGWVPVWGFDETIDRTVDWYRARHLGGVDDARELLHRQIRDYLTLVHPAPTKGTDR